MTFLIPLLCAAHAFALWRYSKSRNAKTAWASIFTFLAMILAGIFDERK